MSDTIPKVVGGFIILPTGQQAISIQHVYCIRVIGREDPDRPRAKDVQLVAQVTYGDGTTGYVLGQFAQFREAEAALTGLLNSIAAPASADLITVDSPFGTGLDTWEF